MTIPANAFAAPSLPPPTHPRPAASSMEWYETAGTIIPPSNGQMLRITAPDAPKAWASASLSFASIVPTEFSYVTLFDSNDAPPFDDEAQVRCSGVPR